MRVGDGDGKALATQTTSLKSTDHENIRRLDIDALIKALKDNGNSFGNTLGHSLAAYSVRSDTEGGRVSWVVWREREPVPS
ncbi:hypothetical protein F2Q68_00044093 [Brassica cretica]|uniref:Uncharacterized protein n=1 Tax=Brassica cretica TaxID=69181 RepID=A0A8S9LNY8_BRACR|nr:hypothetical protein F2Q68_00044093 [Brassica cretica]